MDVEHSAAQPEGPESSDGPFPLLALPHELLFQSVLSLLPHNELASVAAVCKPLHALLKGRCTVRLREAVPCWAFRAHFAPSADGHLSPAMRQLTIRQRRWLVRLTAAAGSVEAENLLLLLKGTTLHALGAVGCDFADEALIGAAEAGHLATCQLLVKELCAVLSDEVGQGMSAWSAKPMSAMPQGPGGTHSLLTPVQAAFGAAHNGHMGCWMWLVLEAQPWPQQFDVEEGDTHNDMFLYGAASGGHADSVQPLLNGIQLYRGGELQFNAPEFDAW
jgi:hypothetical protein